MWVESCLHTSGRKGAREGAGTVPEEGGNRDEASSAISLLRLLSYQLESSFLGSILAASRAENALKKGPGPQLLTF